MANNHMKRFSMSLTISEMQIKTTIIYHNLITFYTHKGGGKENNRKITRVWDDVKKSECLYTARENVKW